MPVRSHPSHLFCAVRAGVAVMFTANQARAVLADLEAQVKTAAKRKTMAAFFATNVAGKLSPEAIAVYRDYAETK